MLSKSSNGTQFDLTGKSAFDHAKMWREHVEAERLQVSKDEMSWLERYRPPSRSVDVTLNLGCGVQYMPHLMLLLVGLFERLGVNFVATAGPQFCCGRYFQRYGMAAGDQLSSTSIKRLSSWNAPTNVQYCGSCYIEFGHQVDKVREETGSAPFEVVHYTKFLRDRLIELGDAVPWVRRVPRRVLLHAEGAETHTTKEQQRGWVIETLGMIPGVEYVGLAEDPSLGRPCVSKVPGEPCMLNDITPEQYRQVQAELEAQAREKGADTIVVHHHLCNREWTKFSSPRLPIINYKALIGDALGLEVTDRFRVLWQLGDPEKILETTRPNWESWGIAEDDAKEMAKRYFMPKYAAALLRCPCEGSCAVADLRHGEDACMVTSG
jgi:hypothetical protein